MFIALFVFGASATPVTGLFVRPDAHGARHGMEMFVDLGRFGWYGYTAVSFAVLTTALIAWRRRTPRGRKVAAGSASALLNLTVVFGAVHVLTLATGVFHGDGRPLFAALAAVAGIAAVVALVNARTYFRYAR